MRVLLDECVHHNLKPSLDTFSVTTVPEAGWRGVKNGELLQLASAHYDVFITSDKNIEYQQHKQSLPLPVIVISTKGNMWENIEPVVPKIKQLLVAELQKKFYRVE